MSSRKRIQRQNPWQPKPAPKMLQSRGLSNGRKLRDSSLPEVDILNFRPFPERKTPPTDTRPVEEKMAGAEFRYNGVEIPTFTPSAPSEDPVLSPFSSIQADGLGQENIQREEVLDSEKEQSEIGIEKQHLAAPPDDGTIQRVCSECEAELEEKEEKEPLQAKLTVGEAGDKYEQEADAVVRDVVEKINSPTTEPTVQRFSLLGGVPKITVMRQSAGGVGEGTSVSQDVEQGIEQARGGGQGLDESVREPMEEAFGADFSGVKVHADGNADQLNRSISARAFTTGQDIFFKQGEYEPSSRGGQELLAHELTHVVQQTGGAVQRQKTVGQQENRDTEAVADSSIPITQQNIIEPRIQCWASPLDWLDYFGLGVDVAERIYIELGYPEGKEKDFKRFVNNLYIAIDTVLAITPGAGGGGLAVRTSHELGVAAWAATPDSIKLRIAEKLAQLMGWTADRALEAVNVFFSARSNRDEQPNTMRFQVQWGSNQGGPTFSEVANASNTGVTTTQAVAALETAVAKVTPKKAKEAAQPAKVKQIAWINSRPPAGIGISGFSKSQYFSYKNYTDARVDVENVSGDNLRI